MLNKLFRKVFLLSLENFSYLLSLFHLIMSAAAVVLARGAGESVLDTVCTKVRQIHIHLFRVEIKKGNLIKGNKFLYS